MNGREKTRGSIKTDFPRRSQTVLDSDGAVCPRGSRGANQAGQKWRQAVESRSFLLEIAEDARVDGKSDFAPGKSRQEERW